MPRVIAFLTAIVFLGKGACACGAVLSLEQLGARAAAGALLLQAHAKELAAAKTAAEGAGALGNPALSLQVGSLRSGGSQGVTIETSLVQPIPFPGKLGAREYVAELDAKLAEASLAEAKLLLQHEAILLGVQWLVLQEEFKHLSDRKRRFSLINEFLRTHPHPSPSQQIEKELIESQIPLLEKGFVAVTEDRKAIAAKLQLYLNSNDEIEIQPQWLDPKMLPVSRDSTAENSGENAPASPELRRRILETERAEGAARQARLERLPDIGLGVGYRLENVQPTNHFYYGSLSLAIPIFDHGQYAGGAATARAEALRARLQWYRRQLAQQLSEAWSRLAAAAEIAAQFPPSLAGKTEMKFERVEREFRKGRLSATVLLQADSQFHETLSSLYDAQLTLVQRLSRVLVLQGLPLSLR